MKLLSVTLKAPDKPVLTTPVESSGAAFVERIGIRRQNVLFPREDFIPGGVVREKEQCTSADTDANRAVSPHRYRADIPVLAFAERISADRICEERVQPQEAVADNPVLARSDPEDPARIGDDSILDDRALDELCRSDPGDKMNSTAGIVIAQRQLRDDESRFGCHPEPAELILVDFAHVKDREPVLDFIQFVLVSVITDEPGGVDDHPDVTEPVLINPSHIRRRERVDFTLRCIVGKR